MAEFTYEQAMTALRNADASGNVEDAKKLAVIADRLKAAPVAPQSENFLTASGAGPIAQGINLALKGLDKAQDVAGSGVTEGMSRLGASPEVSAGLGTAANIGVGAIAPTAIGKAATGAAPILESAARRLMQSSIKPNLAARTSGQADKAITTMLDKGISATEGGL